MWWTRAQDAAPLAHDTGAAPRIPHLDKVVHAVMFLAEGALLRAVSPLRTAVVLGLTLALSTELLQGALPSLGRSCEVADMLADVLGLALGVLGVARWRRRQ